MSVRRSSPESSTETLVRRYPPVAEDSLLPTRYQWSVAGIWINGTARRCRPLSPPWRIEKLPGDDGRRPSACADRRDFGGFINHVPVFAVSEGAHGAESADDGFRVANGGMIHPDGSHRDRSAAICSALTLAMKRSPRRLAPGFLAALAFVRFVPSAWNVVRRLIRIVAAATGRHPTAWFDCFPNVQIGRQRISCHRPCPAAITTAIAPAPKAIGRHHRCAISNCRHQVRSARVACTAETPVVMPSASPNALLLA